MRKNVFIAIGGSGAKVAEALVRLLAIGFPTRDENGVLTSAGDSLQVWRVDPDLSSGAAASLEACIKDYQSLQRHLGEGESSTDVATSRWAMDVESKVRHLNPLDLPRASATDNQIKTLRGILDSSNNREKSSLPFLNAFYEPKDLDVKIDRGFYQKPFIGAAVMAIFAASLNEDNTNGGKTSGLSALYKNEVNFFLCGSLHGGTGACGVPILGRFLGERKQTNPWRVGAGLLAPYCVPPKPPFNALREGEVVTDKMIDSYVEAYAAVPALADLSQKEEKRELVRQILLGFFADPEDMESRARQGLAYYKDHSAEYFDQLYLIGKPEPDRLTTWSNGGASQRNPLNSAEVVAALAALNFFSGTGDAASHSYMVGASTSDLNSKKMRLYQLPHYKILRPNGEQAIDAEKVLFATVVMHHLLLRQIEWKKKAKEWAGLPGLKELYRENESKKVADKNEYDAAMTLVEKFIGSVVNQHGEIAIGWSAEDESQLRHFLSGAETDMNDITKKMATGWWGSEAKGELELGNSTMKVSTAEFGQWSPKGTFTRGEYLRLVWSHLYQRIQSKA
jgi:hypothetical protein